MVFAVLTFSTFGTSNSQNVYLPLEVEFLSPVDLWRISLLLQSMVMEADYPLQERNL